MKQMRLKNTFFEMQSCHYWRYGWRADILPRITENISTSMLRRRRRIWIHVCHDQKGGSLIFVQHLRNHSKSESKAWHCVCLKNLRGMRQSMSNAMLIIVRSLEFELQSEMRLIELASALELSEIRGFVIIVHQNLFCRRFRLLWCH